MTETRKRGSAGMPSMDASDDRVSDLEARLARLEGSPSLRERGRDLMDRVMPSDASRHFRNAGREQLLGVRAIVDHLIRRIDAMDARASGGDPSRERIELD
ncbi:MAG TPA: hypothetical protein VKR30_11225 [Candidatus Limnocylindrales bacterium]|nr:hypothetical protein [Candidatus Limnocylindrales bacterium]